MKTLNVGVIGIGVIATTKHIPNLLKREDVKVTMLSDLDTAKAEKAKEELGLKDAVVCADYREVCTNPDIDVVHVCTANPSHYEIAMLAMNNGKIAMAGTPHEVFSDEKKLKEIQLDIPFSMKMQGALKRRRVNVGNHLTMEGLVKELCQYNSNM